MINTKEEDKKKQKESVLSRLKYLASKGTIREKSKLWGVSGATINAYTTKGTMPSFDRMIEISNAENVSLEWLAYGVDNKESPVEDEIIPIKKYHVSASAGCGSFVDNEESHEIVTLSKSWLRDRKLSHKNLCIIEAKGNSMEPVIHDNDELFISVIEETPSKPFDGVYVVNLDGLLKVKRLEYDFFKDGYSVISDNKEYESDFVNRIDIDRRLRVIAEVALVLGKPKALSNTTSP